MLPKLDGGLTPQTELEMYASRDYRLAGSHLSGEVEGIEAVAQAVYFILNTERYAYIIYSWDYGIELEDLIGQELGYAIPEIERRVSEALAMDERIVEVEDFSFDTSIPGTVHATFTVVSIYGDISADLEVSI